MHTVEVGHGYSKQFLFLNRPISYGFSELTIFKRAHLELICQYTSLYLRSHSVNIMTGIVYNTLGDCLELSWESCALRAALCLFPRTCSVGSSVFIINYEDISTKQNLGSRLKALISNASNEEDKEHFREVANALRLVRKRKQMQKADIVFLKRTEKYIDSIFTHNVEERLRLFEKYGLPQLAPFYHSKNKCLNLWFVNHKAGEENERAALSRLLTFKVEKEEDNDYLFPDVFVFYDFLAKEVLSSKSLTPLATLPNLNILKANQLTNVRNRLQPQREELKLLLPLDEVDEHGNQYFSGTWNLEGVKTFAPRLQQALNTTPDLEWSKSLYPDVHLDLHVGNINTLELWQLLREKELLPDDTWNVLEERRKSGIHCQTTAIMTITSNLDGTELYNLTKEETLKHKRKTINLG